MPQTIIKEVNAEIVEKKSKFIAEIIHVTSKEEAEQKLEEIRKKYHDARHHCFAFRIMEENTIIERASDDGEPSGTAGAPILNILSKNHLVDILVVVTRYFGGILLGTGGLVKAYSEATKTALQNARLVEEVPGYELEVRLSYQQINNFEYECSKQNIKILEKKYEQQAIYIVEIEEKQKELFLKKEEQKKIIEECKIIRKKNVIKCK